MSSTFKIFRAPAMGAPRKPEITTATKEVLTQKYKQSIHKARNSLQRKEIHPHEFSYFFPYISTNGYMDYLFIEHYH